MKRVTVAITIGDYWYCSRDDMRRIQQKMIEAGVAACREQAVSIVGVDAKEAVNVRKPHV